MNNRWWYLFNGIENNIEDFDILILDLVVDTREGTIIYSGYLLNYVCNGEELDRLYLTQTTKREFKINSDNGLITTGSPSEVPGVAFSISYQNVINMNLKFLVLENDISNIQNLQE